MRPTLKAAYQNLARAMARVLSHPDCPPAVADDLTHLADAWADRYSAGPTREEEARRVRERCADWLSQATE